MNSNQKDRQVDGFLNRRDFFKRAAVMGALAAGAGAVMAGCKKGENGASGGANAKGDEAKTGAQAGDGLNCTDTSGLDPSKIKARESVKYVDKTPKPEQDCANCMHYKPAGDGECGGCAVVPGKINPDGWCSVWAAKT